MLSSYLLLFWSIAWSGWFCRKVFFLFVFLERQKCRWSRSEGLVSLLFWRWSHINGDFKVHWTRRGLGPNCADECRALITGGAGRVTPEVKMLYDSCTDVTFKNFIITIVIIVIFIITFFTRPCESILFHLKQLQWKPEALSVVQ